MAFAVSVMANSAAAAWQAFDGDVLVGVDADVAGDLHGFAGDCLGIQGIDVDQGARRRQRERPAGADADERSEEHTSELQSLMRISYAVFFLKKKKHNSKEQRRTQHKSD